jgi:DNA-binding PadR family transcriptional regulator
MTDMEGIAVYELLILSFLMRGKMHGYLMAKIINDIIGPYAKFSHGRMYPLLSKLEADGLIGAAEDAAEHGQGDRRQRAFTITEAGRKRFHQLMMDTTSSPGGYREIFWMKFTSFEMLQPDERLFLMDHYLNYCQTHIFHLMNQMEELERDVKEQHFMTDQRPDVTLHVIRHAINQWRLESKDVTELREREIARMQPDAQHDTMTTEEHPQ